MSKPKFKLDFEYILQQKIGGFGRWQRLQLFILSWALCLVWATNFSFPLLAYKVPFTCYENDTINSSCSHKCQKWTFENYGRMKASTVSKWLLMCDRSCLRSQMQMAFFVGFGLGIVISNIICKRVGNKKVLFVSTILYVIFGCISPYSYYYWLFVCMRAASGAASAAIFCTTFHLIFDNITTQFLPLVCCLLLLPRILAFQIVGGFGAALKNWSTLAILISAPAFALTAVDVWLVAESPRWLLKHGRRSDAVRILRRMSRMNGHERLKSTGADISTDTDVYSCIEHTNEKLLQYFRDDTENILNFLWIAICWVLVAYTYHTISLGCGFLPSLFLPVALTGLFEFPALIAAVLINKYKRSHLVTIFAAVSSLLCFIGMAFGHTQYSSLLSMLLASKVCVTVVELWLSVITIEFCSGDLRTIVYLIMVALGSIGSVGSAYTAPLIEVKPFIPFLTCGICMLCVSGLGFMLPNTFKKEDIMIPLAAVPLQTLSRRVEIEVIEKNDQTSSDVSVFGDIEDEESDESEGQEEAKALNEEANKASDPAVVVEC